MRQLEEHVAQNDELGQPAVGGQQDQVEVVDVDDTEPKGNQLRHEYPVLEILRNMLLTKHISNSAFSPSLESSRV